MERVAMHRVLAAQRHREHEELSGSEEEDLSPHRMPPPTRCPPRRNVARRGGGRGTAGRGVGKPCAPPPSPPPPPSHRRNVMSEDEEELCDSEEAEIAKHMEIVHDKHCVEEIIEEEESSLYSSEDFNDDSKSPKRKKTLGIAKEITVSPVKTVKRERPGPLCSKKGANVRSNILKQSNAVQQKHSPTKDKTSQSPKKDKETEDVNKSKGEKTPPRPHEVGTLHITSVYIF